MSFIRSDSISERSNNSILKNMAKKGSTLTLRLDSEEAKRLDKVKKLTRESTSSGAIDKAIRSYPDHLQEIYEQKEMIEQLESKLTKSEEVFDSLRTVIRYASGKR